MTQDSTLSMSDSISVRSYLTDALRLDLIGPRSQDAELQNERLPQAPSRWYLTGFLVPTNAPDEQRAQDNEEEFDEAVEPFHGSDDSSTPDGGSGKQNFLPSSMGLSIIVDDDTTGLDVEVSWGDYAPEPNEKEKTAANGGTEPATDNDNGEDKSSQRRFSPWVRHPHTGSVTINLSDVKTDQPVPFKVPDSNGLELICLVRPTRVQRFDNVLNAWAVSVFIVNRRTPEDRNDLQDTAFAFQVEMSVEADRPLSRVPIHTASKAKTRMNASRTCITAMCSHMRLATTFQRMLRSQMANADAYTQSGCRRPPLIVWSLHRSAMLNSVWRPSVRWTTQQPPSNFWVRW